MNPSSLSSVVESPSEVPVLSSSLLPLADETSKARPNMIVDDSMTFEMMGLDRRLYLAVLFLGYRKPTLVQAAAIPLALEGKDILARARTGSGKTAAYLLPILQSLLEKKKKQEESDSVKSEVSSVILVPSKELVEQVNEQATSLLRYCSNSISVLPLRSDSSITEQKARLAEKPDVIISTPARLLTHLKDHNISLTQSLSTFVVDEADLLLSYGYEDDLNAIRSFLPTSFQGFLMSATLDESIEKMKNLILHNPAILRLEGVVDETAGLLRQYYLGISEADKFLVLYCILKFRLLPGKVLIFVNSLDRCYRAKLFLERFGIKAAVLNSELPSNTRYNIVQQFNKGMFQYLLATDERVVENPRAFVSSASGKKIKEKRKRKSSKEEDKEFGVSRGVDFRNVDAVVNFDLPRTVGSYTHRIGRTARGGRDGIALTLVDFDQQKDTFIEIFSEQENRGNQLNQFEINMDEVEAFRYRSNDVLRQLGPKAVRKARAYELKTEILNSEKLKEYFAEKPDDLMALQHDMRLAPQLVEKALHSIPSYLAPKNLQPSQFQMAMSSSFLKQRKFKVRTRRSNKPAGDQNQNEKSESSSASTSSTSQVSGKRNRVNKRVGEKRRKMNDPLRSIPKKQ